MGTPKTNTNMKGNLRLTRVPRSSILEAGKEAMRSADASGRITVARKVNDPEPFTRKDSENS